MKLKTKLFSLLFMVMFIFTAVPAMAEEKSINSIEINVILNDDGSANITETWDISGISGGTEYYKALNNMDGMNVHSLIVYDETGKQFENVETWNTKLSLEEKAGKSGILTTSKGYELCWGMGSYGDHQYTISYVIDNLVKDYGDYAGFYHQFLGDLSSAPKAVFVKIKLNDANLTTENSEIWGYGFPGTVEVENDSGILMAFSEKKLSSSDYVNLLCKFDRSLFSQASTADKSFESLKKQADSKNSNVPIFIFVGSIIAGSIILIVLISFFYSRYKLDNGIVVRLPSEKKIEANPSIPFAGNIPAIYAALQALRRVVPFNQVFSAYLFKWQNDGIISMKEKDTNKNSSADGDIIFDTDKEPTSAIELSLYKILIKYTDNNILSTKKIEKNYVDFDKSITSWTENFEEEGNKELIRLNVLVKEGKNKFKFTEAGFEQATRIIGLKNYLLKLQSDNSKNAGSREIWGDYLVLSALFGIAKQVLKSMEVIDPNYFNNYYYGYSYYHMLCFVNTSHNVSHSVAQHSASASGGGGFSGGGGGGSR